ncbi:MAG TPA: sulfide/dihydroorotate dehydrogenase-like FAD/NAD-binding protein [Deltaproteobacteria bacterium]|nr:sulfide/dihydroorotate dehydrogenase-like FAD/NAD-binding protein [Deltaproteobacteria bacterium]HPJ93158.1 sulfide/dihydroorotate dehydrogenase-like FAD/NAD-binding protein [Deltaproteobacteria bacterium]HPR52110.1 sulfide/dihydroorotate dehydrogenase-like FAD/NAD-binding protein [Deltaproteobacteria bacterium]
MAAKILEKEQLSENVFKLVLDAPRIAKKRKAGQFIVLRIHEEGERVPLTIADADAEKGTLTIIFQTVGKSTTHLSEMNAGDELLDLVGPLGQPTHIEKIGTIACIGGGVGVAPVYPITEAMKKAGNHIISIIGARDKSLIIMEDEMKAVSDEFIVATDDGSYGFHGFVSQALEEKYLLQGKKIDLVVAIGPVPMMRAVCDTTKKYNVPTVVSLNSIMVDATGMCGACRVSVGGKTKFVCVDGPEFDGHQVDFRELIDRQRIYLDEEKECMDHYCTCKQQGKGGL